MHAAPGCTERAAAGRVYYNPFDGGVAANVVDFLLAVTAPPLTYTARPEAGAWDHDLVHVS